MQAIAEDVRPGRQLHHIINLQAADDATAALRHAAADDPVLAAAAAVLANGENGAAHDKLRDAVTSGAFLAKAGDWIRELRGLASSHPSTGSCTVASALDLWAWTVAHFRGSETQALDDLADAVVPLLAARCLARDLAAKPENEVRADLCHVYAAHAASQAGAACAELVFGYRKHLVWDAEGCASCFAGEEIDDLEALMPGIASGARMATDVVEADGWHTPKAGPCASFEGLDAFMRLRHKLDGCLTGARIAKERAAAAIARSIEGSEA